MTDPTPDLTALCDVLNEAADTPAGTNLLPYAERIKAIVIEALAQEAEDRYPFGAMLDDRKSTVESVAVWLRSLGREESQ